MWRYIALFALSLLIACAELAVSVPGAPPRGISVELGSRVRYTPYSPEQLDDPAIQSIIAQCERQGGTHCSERICLANSRTKFIRTQDKKVFVKVTLGGLESDRDYEVHFKLFDPDGNMRARYAYKIHIPIGFPANATADYWFYWIPPDLSTWQLGLWGIEIAINDKVEFERTFYVID